MCRTLNSLSAVATKLQHSTSSGEFTDVAGRVPWDNIVASRESENLGNEIGEGRPDQDIMMACNEGGTS